MLNRQGLEYFQEDLTPECSVELMGDFIAFEAASASSFAHVSSSASTDMGYPVQIRFTEFGVMNQKLGNQCVERWKSEWSIRSIGHYASLTRFS